MTEPSTQRDTDGPTMAGGPYLGGPGNDAGYTAGLPRPNHADEIPDEDDAAKDTISASGAGPAAGGGSRPDEPGVDEGAVNPS
jgi:hypothetical protein